MSRRGAVVIGGCMALAGALVLWPRIRPMSREEHALRDPDAAVALMASPQFALKAQPAFEEAAAHPSRLTPESRLMLGMAKAGFMTGVIKAKIENCNEALEILKAPFPLKEAGTAALVRGYCLTKMNDFESAADEVREALRSERIDLYGDEIEQRFAAVLGEMGLIEKGKTLEVLRLLMSTSIPDVVSLRGDYLDQLMYRRWIKADDVVQIGQKIVKGADGEGLTTTRWLTVLVGLSLQQGALLTCDPAALCSDEMARVEAELLEAKTKYRADGEMKNNSVRALVDILEGSFGVRKPASGSPDLGSAIAAFPEWYAEPRNRARFDEAVEKTYFWPLIEPYAR